jgi:hypothetical protein
VQKQSILLLVPPLTGSLLLCLLFTTAVNECSAAHSSSAVCNERKLKNGPEMLQPESSTPLQLPSNTSTSALRSCKHPPETFVPPPDNTQMFWSCCGQGTSDRRPSVARCSVISACSGQIANDLQASLSTAHNPRIQATASATNFCKQPSNMVIPWRRISEHDCTLCCKRFSSTWIKLATDTNVCSIVAIQQASLSRYARHIVVLRHSFIIIDCIA